MLQETGKEATQTENESVEIPAMTYTPKEDSPQRCLQTHYFLEVRQQNKAK